MTNFKFIGISGRWYSVLSNEVAGIAFEAVGQIEQRAPRHWRAMPRNSEQWLPGTFRTRELAAEAASKAFYGHNWSAM